MLTSSKIHRRGFTLIELLVVISIIALLLGILVPMLGKAKQSASVMKESANIRNIEQGLAVYASSNKDWFPGLTSVGLYRGTVPYLGRYYAADANTTPAAPATAVAAVDACNNYAMAVVLEEVVANPAQWYSGGETGATSGASQSMVAVAPNTSGVSISSVGVQGTVTNSNNSYAMLAYGAPSLKPEWKSNFNSKAVVLGSRLIFGASATEFHSLWNEEGRVQFKGAIARGDGSTTIEMFGADNGAGLFPSLQYGQVSGSVAPSPTAKVAAVFAKTTVVGPATSGDNYDAADGFGALAPAGSFTTGMIGSANN